MNHIKVHSRDGQAVGVAHKIKPIKNQSKISQMMMGQCWLDKIKLLEQPKILLKSCYRLLKEKVLMEFLLTD